jgi:hypothetical protein
MTTLLTADTLHTIYQTHSRQRHLGAALHRTRTISGYTALIGSIGIFATVIAHLASLYAGATPPPLPTYLLLGGAVAAGTAVRALSTHLADHVHATSSRTIAPVTALIYTYDTADRTQPFTDTELEQHTRCLTDIAAEDAAAASRQRLHHATQGHRDLLCERAIGRTALTHLHTTSSIAAAAEDTDALQRLARWWPLTCHTVSNWTPPGATGPLHWNAHTHRYTLPANDGTHTSRHQQNHICTALHQHANTTLIAAEQQHSTAVLNTARQLATDDPDHHHTFTDLINTAAALTPL